MSDKPESEKSKNALELFHSCTDQHEGWILHWNLYLCIFNRLRPNLCRFLDEEAASFDFA
jgi:hypothetical protein